MTWAVVAGAVIGAGGAYLASQNSADAAQSAANTQADANRYAADIQKQMFERQIELQKPWYDVGTRALPKLEAQYNAMPAAFTGKVNLNQDPGYAFRLAEGNRALNQAAAARGGLISGNALKAAERYGQQMGSQEYGNAYQRALDVYNAAVKRETTGYNRLASLAGVGQTAAGDLASQAGQYGSNISSLASQTGQAQANALLSQGAARSSAYQGYGSALGQGIGGIGNYLNYGNNSNPSAFQGWLNNQNVNYNMSGGLGGGENPVGV